jgi:hypothetical protein
MHMPPTHVLQGNNSLCTRYPWSTHTTGKKAHDSPRTIVLGEADRDNPLHRMLRTRAMKGAPLNNVQQLMK